MSEAYEAAVEIREAILERFPTEKERRRYALLQTAATLHAVPVLKTVESRPVESPPGYRTGRTKHTTVHTYPSAGSCVDRAEALLAEIERRGK